MVFAQLPNLQNTVNASLQADPKSEALARLRDHNGYLKVLRDDPDVPYLNMLFEEGKVTREFDGDYIIYRKVESSFEVEELVASPQPPPSFHYNQPWAEPEPTNEKPRRRNVSSYANERLGIPITSTPSSTEGKLPDPLRLHIAKLPSNPPPPPPPKEPPQSSEETNIFVDRLSPGQIIFWAIVIWGLLLSVGIGIIFAISP